MGGPRLTHRLVSYIFVAPADYTYDMLVDGVRISVSIATAEFKPAGDGTRLTFTEQGVFLDGHEVSARREQGMGTLLGALGQWLQNRRPGGG